MVRTQTSHNLKLKLVYPKAIEVMGVNAAAILKIPNIILNIEKDAHSNPHVAYWYEQCVGHT